jgi:hypothetical protein
VRALGKLLGSTTLVLDVLKCGNVNPYDMGTFLSEEQDDHPIEAALHLNLQAERMGGWQVVRNSVLNAAGSPQCPQCRSYTKASAPAAPQWNHQDGNWKASNCASCATPPRGA